MEKESTDFILGSQQSLLDAMDKYSQPLLRYCHNILCDYHEAQDALQITFIKAYQKRASIKKDMRLSPWLYKIAYNTCVDIIRKRRYTEQLKDYQQEVESGRIPEDILAALLKLNSIDRSVVYGRVINEMSYDELAKIHGKSPATLRKRFERARKRLAEELKESYPYYTQNNNSPKEELV